MNEERIISIYPNTMGFGFVVLNDKGEILDFGVVSYRPVSSERCLNRIKEVVSYYQPNICILEDYKNSHKSMRIKNLIDKISDHMKDSAKIFKYSRVQIRDTFEVFGARNKYEISQKVCEVYPQFISKLPEKRKAWEPENYYQGIFDAVSLVLVFFPA